MDILKLEMEKKMEEFQTIILAHASEIAEILWIPKLNHAKIFQNQKIAVLVLNNM